MGERTESSIQISATPDEVLAAVADIASYPSWVAGITGAEVRESDEAGRPVRARLSLSSGPIKDDLLVAYDWDLAADATGTQSWSLEQPGRVTTVMNGAYELAHDGAGTRVSYRLEVDVSIPMPGVLRRRAEKTIIDSALKGLKRHVER